MAGYELYLTQEENITVSVPSVRRLIAAGNGDASLLYLCLLKNRGGAAPETLMQELGWDGARLHAAEDALAQAGLIGRPDAPESPRAFSQERTPEYSRDDISRKIEQDGSFAALLREVERKLGTQSTPSVAKLLGLYEHLGLPADVIFLLVGHCIERMERQYGAFRRPTMAQIEKEGYVWARHELFSTAAANEYLKKYNAVQRRFPELMRVLQLGDRNPVAGEERYLKAWVEMGFAPEVVALAYEKTIMKCRELKWSYLNGILKKWHEKGLHTLEQVSSENTRTDVKNSAKTDEWKNKYFDTL